jgi:hypothetical protein
MNLEEIKQASEIKIQDEVNELLSTVINNIDKYMIDHYEEIKEQRDITINEKNINVMTSSFTKQLRPLLLKKIQEHYFKDWAISHLEEDKRSYNRIFFKLKEQPEKIDEQQIEETNKQQNKVNQTTNRYEILDL